MSKQLDETVSREIANNIKSKAKDSFDNAYKAALATEGALYVQGFLVLAAKPYRIIEHSWIELEEQIIDPTLPFLNHKAQDLYYYPAQQLTLKQLKAAIEEAQEDYPEDNPLPVYGAAPYEYYGDVMLGGAEYLAAYQAAEAKWKELSDPQYN
ncbi:hypothetical protein IQ230_07895 [Gloeocapsopsis crepidinum LEGE 06123]|uniref:Uncharacterized protein n=1 Tax=Gloeocapsopsis crepidinum LEGE 06123 TaxID=588587 RepID=A0ABR9UPR1_9CHRO|nr:hypothetical protein [Gloeocapsopsis crepidinum]MBE9190282.1 hypothetical protein [Gloeocapsopsis crepidinum LEGE 06123]